MGAAGPVPAVGRARCSSRDFLAAPRCPSAVAVALDDQFGVRVFRLLGAEAEQVEEASGVGPKPVVPPLDDAELVAVCANAAEYAKNPAGSKLTAPRPQAASRVVIVRDAPEPPAIRRARLHAIEHRRMAAHRRMEVRK